MDQLNPKHPLLVLVEHISWESSEKEFAPLYIKLGKPTKPIRLMLGLLILKQIKKLSDESVVEVWEDNSYFQAFCGIDHFQFKAPCNPSDLVHFRNCIGEK